MKRPMRCALAAAAVATVAAFGAATAHAANLRACDRPANISATEQDRQLRVAALIRQTLQQSGESAAIIARAGLDLSRFGVRYSHAGISLQANPNSAWSVRQLYYACDESRPRIFDQGLAGFIQGSDNPLQGFISLLLLPEPQASALARAALDRPQALALLGGDYSANAYAFSTRFQNCNQWVMELLASAWGGFDAAPPTRAQAQQWLAQQGYDPQPVNVDSQALMFAAHFTPLIHVSDHPLADIQSLKLRVSMPASIEAFARQQAPQAQRIEFCYNPRQAVVRRNGPPLSDACEAAPGDEVMPFD